jgi:hypothetical protein
MRNEKPLGPILWNQNVERLSGTICQPTFHRSRGWNDAWNGRHKMVSNAMKNNTKHWNEKRNGGAVRHTPVPVMERSTKI